MPLYEYRCNTCGEEFEELVSISAEETPSCPACGSPETGKRISAFASFGGDCGSGGGPGFT